MRENDEILVETVRQWRRGWWGGHWEPPQPLSVVELMQAGSIDARLLAIIWLCLEAHGSVLVAAEPPEAGKTTTLTALLEFLPPAATRIYTRGFDDTLAALRQVEPASGWILCNEISPDLPVYTWGPAVTTLFDALDRGYAVATTMHADTLEAIVAVLTGYPLSVPRRRIGYLSLVITLRIRYTAGQVVRRVDAAHILEPSDNGLDGYTQTQIARHDEQADRLMHNSGAAVRFLARRTGQDPTDLQAEVERRALYLTDLRQREVSAVGEVRQALAAYTPVLALSS